MSLETLLNFRSADSTEYINARLSGLIPKGVVKGGVVVPEPASLQVRVRGDGVSPFILLAFAADGMVIREMSEEHVLPVTAGITSVLCLRAKYVAAINGTVARFEMIPLGSYQTDADPDSIIRLCSISPPAGVTAVLTEHINMGYRDSIEGFSRKIVRGVVDTKEDLPAVSGFPATAEVNFLKNTFAMGTTITLGTPVGTVNFPIVAAGAWKVASPTEPGLARVNPSQKAIHTDAPLFWSGLDGHGIGIKRNASTGVVTCVTLTPHNFLDDSLGGAATKIRISECSTSSANGVWTVKQVIDDYTFTFQDFNSTTAWSGSGGNVIDVSVDALITVKLAEGLTHSLMAGVDRVRLSGASDPSFNSYSLSFVVADVPDARTVVYQMAGYPTGNSGNGLVTKEGYIVPNDGVEIGESSIATAANFALVANASILGTDIRVTALGSSNQLEAIKIGVSGNVYTLAKNEPNTLPANQSIVISGSHFTGGTDPNPSTSNVDLQSGDLYVVIYGTSGTLEIWGYDGAIFRNLTSASTATLLDFHRRNQFLNEGHLTENQKAALVGTVGVPSASNKYVTQQDTSILTTDIADALEGADGVAPNSGNRYVTEARRRGEIGRLDVPASQAGVDIPLTNGSDSTWQLILGEDAINPIAGFLSAKAIPFFNVVHKETLLNAGGPTEYSQVDFTPVTVERLYIGTYPDTSLELTPSLHMDSSGVFPILTQGKPTTIWAKLSAAPNNGTATLMYSRVITEKYRKPFADMYAPPQRILPAAFQDVINRVAELRFNSGIALSGSTVTFPAGLFSSSNVQGFTLRRIVNGKPVALTSSFSVDFEAGSDGTGLVKEFIPAGLPSSARWTKYLLSLTSNGKIKVTHIANLLEYGSDVAFASSRTDVSLPAMPFADGSYTFACVSVYLSGATGTTTLSDLTAQNIELYPYQGTNERGSCTPIICGDGVESFGHFTGADSHIRAMNWATDGSVLRLGRGSYAGSLVVSKDDMTVEGFGGATLTHSSVTRAAAVVVGSRCTLKDLKFNAPIAVDVQSGADDFRISGLLFGPLVSTKIKSPLTYTFGNVGTVIPLTGTIAVANTLAAGTCVKFKGSLPPLQNNTSYFVVNPTDTTFQVSDTKGGNPIIFSSGGTGTFGNGNINNMDGHVSFNHWIVSDGTNSYGVGDFNSTDGIQECHDDARVLVGDRITILAGTYNRFTVTKDRLQFKAEGNVIIDGGNTTEACIIVYGSFNEFDGLSLKNAPKGIECKNGSTYNAFLSSVIFGADVANAIVVEPTSGKHYNTHPLISGKLISGVGISGVGTTQKNPEVTVGDGVNSWGDYVGPDAIDLALAGETGGTKVIVRRGTYKAVNAQGNPFNNLIIEGSGAGSVIDTGGEDIPCVNVVGSGNKISGFYLKASGNDSLNFKTYGILVTGSDNTFDGIRFEDSGSNRIEPPKKYKVTSGYRNRFVPHTGAATGYVNWTVGDGVHSFGDFIGSITAAIQALPSSPMGAFGTFSDATALDVNGKSTVVFTANTEVAKGPLTFVPNDLFRYLNINSASSLNPHNIGSFKVIDISGDFLSATLVREDTHIFVDEALSITWDFTTGSKILVLAGQYPPFIIPIRRNDVDIEAFGGGTGDTMIVGGDLDTTLVQIEGSRCRIKGFRFCGGDPLTGVAIAVNGKNCTFERNSFDTAVRYEFGSEATGNRVFDSIEAQDRTCLTVGTMPSRADYVGTTGLVIQAAVDEAFYDHHISKVVLGRGTWTLTETINVPHGVMLEGSGYESELVGDGTFPALTLSDDDGQTIKGIRFNNFSSSLISVATNPLLPLTKVFAYNNWLESAPIDSSVTGSITMNI